MSKTTAAAAPVLGVGGNSEAELKHRVERRLELLAEADELREKLADYKMEDKADGYTEQAIADAVKLRRADPEKVLKVLTLEAERTVYRKAAGVVTDIAEAAKAAREHAESVPEPKGKKKRKGSE